MNALATQVGISISTSCPKASNARSRPLNGDGRHTSKPWSGQSSRPDPFLLNHAFLQIKKIKYKQLLADSGYVRSKTKDGWLREQVSKLKFYFTGMDTPSAVKKYTQKPKTEAQLKGLLRRRENGMFWCFPLCAETMIANPSKPQSERSRPKPLPNAIAKMLPRGNNKLCSRKGRRTLPRD